MRQVLIAVVAVAAVALLEGLYYTLRFVSDRKQEELRRRLKSLGTGNASSIALLKREKLSSIPSLDALLRGIRMMERLESLIAQAGLELTVARLLGYMGAAAAADITIAAVARTGPLGMLMLGGVAGFVPLFAVMAARDRRSAKLSEQLPDALDMMARSLRAGHALTSTFKLVASEMPEPINLEFGRAFEEQNLGLPFERAVVMMTERAPTNRDLKIFAVSVIVQKETGGNLVEIVEKIAETIRARYRFFGKLKTLTAEGRMSAAVLGALPILTGLFIFVANPKYMALTFSEPLGRTIFFYALISWAFGFIWMRRMARVDL